MAITNRASLRDWPNEGIIGSWYSEENAWTLQPGIKKIESEGVTTSALEPTIFEATKRDLINAIRRDGGISGKSIVKLQSNWTPELAIIRIESFIPPPVEPEPETP